MHALIHLAVLAATVWGLARFLPGVRVHNPTTAVVVAVVFSVLNWVLGWMIKLLLVIPAILTLGLLFFFVPLIVNAAVLWITDKFVEDFEIRDSQTLWIAARQEST